MLYPILLYVGYSNMTQYHSKYYFNASHLRGDDRVYFFSTIAYDRNT